MAEEAVVRIVFRDDGGAGASPTGGAGPGASAGRSIPPAVPSQPPAPAQASAPAGRGSGAPAVGTLDVLTAIGEEFRGTLGGVLGSLAGAGLDAALALRQVRDGFQSVQRGSSPPAPPTPVVPQVPVAAPAAPPAPAPVSPVTAPPVPASPVTPPVPAPAAPPAPAPTTPAAAGAAAPAAAGAATAYAPASAAATTAALGFATGIVAAIAAVLTGLRDAGTQAVDSLASFAAGLARFDSNAPAAALEGWGKQVESNTANLVYLGNAFGVLGPVVGHTAQGMGTFMRALDSLSGRYADYSPQVAQAEAMSEVSQVLGDMRRSAAVGPELARYVAARSEAQQRIEDIKIQLLQRILPLVTTGLDLANASAETIKQSLDALVQATSDIPIIGDLIKTIAGLMEPSPVDLQSATDLILSGPGLKEPPEGEV